MLDAKKNKKMDNEALKRKIKYMKENEFDRTDYGYKVSAAFLKEFDIIADKYGSIYLQSNGEFLLQKRIEKICYILDTFDLNEELSLKVINYNSWTTLENIMQDIESYTKNGTYNANDALELIQKIRDIKEKEANFIKGKLYAKSCKYFSLNYEKKLIEGILKGDTVFYPVFDINGFLKYWINYSTRERRYLDK